MPKSLSENKRQNIGVNSSIVRTNIRRFWPGSALMLFVYLIASLFMYVNTSMYVRGEDFERNFIDGVYTMADFLRDQAFFITDQGAATSFGMFAAIAGGVTAMLCFGYLMNARTAVMAHSLPLRRETHLLSAAVSGLLLLAAPIVAGGLLFFTALGVNGLFAAHYVLYWMFANLATALLCFCITAFVAMLTGNSIAHGILTIVLVNLPLMVEGILIGNCGRFLFGFVGWDPVTLSINPFYRIAMYFSDVGQRFDAGSVQNFVTPLLFIAIGAALLAFAALIYRKRRTEAAGDVIAARAVRPILRYGSALGFATLLDMVFSLIHRGGGLPSVAGDIVFSVIGGAFGFFLAEMFIRRTVRVFHRWHGVAGFSLVFALVFLFIRYDAPNYGALKLDESKLDVILIGESIERRPESALLGQLTESHYGTFADLDLSDPDGVLAQRSNEGRARRNVPLPREITEQIIAKDEYVIHAGTPEAQTALELQNLIADNHRHFSADYDADRWHDPDARYQYRYVTFIARYTDGRIVRRQYSITTGPVTQEDGEDVFSTPADENLERLLTQMREFTEEANGRTLVNCARFADYMYLTVNEPGEALLAKTAGDGDGDGADGEADGAGAETAAAAVPETMAQSSVYDKDYMDGERRATLNRGEWDGLFEAYARDLAEFPAVDYRSGAEASRVDAEVANVEIVMPDGYSEYVSIERKHATAVAWLAAKGYIDTGN